MTPVMTYISEGRLDMEQGSVRRNDDSQKDACMKFYDASRSLYLETYASDVCLGARLLQVRDGLNCRHDKDPDNTTLCPIAFTSKSLLSTKWHCSNIEYKALGILHGLEGFHHYCFARKECIIIDH